MGTRAAEIRRKVKEAIRLHITKDQFHQLPHQGRDDQGSTADAVPQTPQLEATSTRRNDQGSPALAGHKRPPPSTTPLTQHDMEEFNIPPPTKLAHTEPAMQSG